MAAEQNTRRKSYKPRPVSIDELSANTPPQAEDVEAAVIGAALVEPGCVDDVLGELSPSCFHNIKLRTIFEAMGRLNDAHVSIDVITVAQELKKTNRLKDSAGDQKSADGGVDSNDFKSNDLEEIGGAVFLADLSQKIGAAAHVEYYIQILKQKDIQRKLITASYEILRDSFDESVNVDDLMVSAQGKIFDAVQDNMHGEVESIGHAINDAIANMQARQESGSEFSGVRSGFRSLDTVTLGFQPSDLIILAARPSVGKTAFVVNIARNAAVDFNTPVAIFSLEMPSVQLASRMMISETGLDAQKIKGGKKMEDYEWAQLDIKLKNLSKAPIYIDSTPSLPIYEFRSKAKRLVAQKGVQLIIVDYLQLMQGPKELRGMREQEVAAISRTLKATAKELNVPIIALSQLSRQVTQRTTSNSRPQLSDLRESGSIEQDADMVLFLHRLDYQGLSDKPEDQGKTILIIAKHRNGQIGDIELVFRSSEVKFVDMSDSLSSQVKDFSSPRGSAMNSAPAPELPDDFDDASSDPYSNFQNPDFN